MFTEQYTERQIAVITGRIQDSEITVPELRIIYRKALFLWDDEVRSFAKQKLKDRGASASTQKHPLTNGQKALISGAVDLETVLTNSIRATIKRIKERGTREDALPLENELKRRGSWRERDEPYTVAESNIVRGIVPLEYASTGELSKLIKKAEYMGDSDVAKAVGAELESRNMLLKNVEYYTPRQEDIVFGRVSRTNASARELVLIAEKARALRHQSVYKSIEEIIARKTARAHIDALRKERNDMVSGRIPVDEVRLREIDELLNKDMDEMLAEIQKITAHITPSERERDHELHERFQKIVAADRREPPAAFKNPKLLAKKQQSVASKPSKKEKAAKKDPRAAKPKKPLEYTARQKMIINGDIPLYKVHLSEIKSLIRKASKLDDSATIDRMMPEMELRTGLYDETQPYDDIQQLILMSIQDVKVPSVPSRLPQEERADPFEPTLSSEVEDYRDDSYTEDIEKYGGLRPYTELQAKILKGTISLDSVRGQDISKVIKKAKRFGDAERADELEQYLSSRYKGTSYERPAAVTFSNEQFRVAGGKIPYEEIKVKDLRNLCREAKLNGESELVSLLELLIFEKEEDAKERARKSHNRNYYLRRGFLPPDSENGHRRNYVRKTVQWGIDVLESRIWSDMCTMKDLQNLRLYAIKENNAVYKAVAEFLISVRKDPSIVYATTDHESTKALINELTELPIRWPDEWTLQ